MFTYQEEKGEKTAAPDNVLSQKLLDSRSIIISGEVDQELAQKVTAQLLILQELGDAPVKLFLNSQGGHVEAGDTIHDMIRFVRPPVIIIGTGWVASAGVTIYLAVPRERRLALPNTRFMIHQPAGGVRGSSTDIAIEANEIIRTRARINEMISRATGQPLERVERDTDRNYWMSVDEAMDYGLVGAKVSSYNQL